LLKLYPGSRAHYATPLSRSVFWNCLERRALQLMYACTAYIWHKAVEMTERKIAAALTKS